jgi:hypothetical protein
MVIHDPYIIVHPYSFSVASIYMMLHTPSEEKEKLRIKSTIGIYRRGS